MFCMYFCCPWGQRREGWCPTRAPRNGPISPLSLGGNTAGVRWHWVFREPNPSGDTSALCKSLVPGFSRNYQATGELPNCLILSTQLYSKNRHCWWMQRFPGYDNLNRRGWDCSEWFCPYNGFEAQELPPQTSWRIMSSLWGILVEAQSLTLTDLILGVLRESSMYLNWALEVSQ